VVYIGFLSLICTLKSEDYHPQPLLHRRVALFALNEDRTEVSKFME